MAYSKWRLLALAAICLSCVGNSSPLKEIFAFPEQLDEISGIETTTKSKAIWALQDSGNEAELYALDLNGKISHTLAIGNAGNIDWEDLSSDPQGNLYIGDFGNNHNVRENLCIYKINAKDLAKAETDYAAKIDFYYPEQQYFPPLKKERFYDAEAFFYFQNHFYIFTKNRAVPYEGSTLLYRVENKPGRHAAKFLGKFLTCNSFRKCAITSADISPDGKKVVLLSGAKIWILENFKGDAFFSGDSREVNLKHFSQKEGVCFKGNSKLYIADERDKKSGGNLYSFDLSKLKAKP